MRGEKTKRERQRGRQRGKQRGEGTKRGKEEEVCNQGKYRFFFFFSLVTISRPYVWEAHITQTENSTTRFLPATGAVKENSPSHVMAQNRYIGHS